MKKQFGISPFSLVCPLLFEKNTAQGFLLGPYFLQSFWPKPDVVLRMYLLQCWFNLSDEAVEDAIYDSYAMRSFLKINFLTEQSPDATTLLKFREALIKALPRLLREQESKKCA